MTAINWRLAQGRLGVSVDGVPGQQTYGALFALAAGRSVDLNIRDIAAGARATLDKYGITESAERLAEFLAETAHESAGYARFSENMNYSAERLTEVWPSRFPTLASAAPYANNPRALANKVYGNRMGNRLGTDDGWNNRGGGILQHTGAREYGLLRSRLGFTPEDVRNPSKTLVAACDFMERAGTMGFVDRRDYAGARRSINGGTIGLDEVAKIRAKVLGVLI